MEKKDSSYLNVFELFAGFTTNGEFNSLRWKGNSRPLTILTDTEGSSVEIQRQRI